jgi:hypothetical protein
MACGLLALFSSTFQLLALVITVIIVAAVLAGVWDVDGTAHYPVGSSSRWALATRAAVRRCAELQR